MAQSVRQLYPAIARGDRGKCAKLFAAAKQEARKGAHLLPGEGAATLVAEADGSFLRIVSTDDGKPDRRRSGEVQYREARLCAACAKGSRSIYYDATFSDVRNIAGLWSFDVLLTSRAKD